MSHELLRLCVGELASGDEGGSGRVTIKDTGKTRVLHKQTARVITRTISLKAEWSLTLKTRRQELHSSLRVPVSCSCRRVVLLFACLSIQ